MKKLIMPKTVKTRLQITGKMEIHGVTKDVTIDTAHSLKPAMNSFCIVNLKLVSPIIILKCLPCM